MWSSQSQLSVNLNRRISDDLQILRNATWLQVPKDRLFLYTLVKLTVSCLCGHHGAVQHLCPEGPRLLYALSQPLSLRAVEGERLGYIDVKLLAPLMIYGWGWLSVQRAVTCLLGFHFPLFPLCSFLYRNGAAA
jgi:hypothetical protein